MGSMLPYIAYMDPMGYNNNSIWYLYITIFRWGYNLTYNWGAPSLSALFLIKGQNWSLHGRHVRGGALQWIYWSIASGTVWNWIIISEPYFPQKTVNSAEATAMRNHPSWFSLIFYSPSTYLFKSINGPSTMFFIVSYSWRVRHRLSLVGGFNPSETY